MQPLLHEVQQQCDDLVLFDLLISDWEQLAQGDEFVQPTITIIRELNAYARQHPLGSGFTIGYAGGR